LSFSAFAFFWSSADSFFSPFLPFCSSFLEEPAPSLPVSLPFSFSLPARPFSLVSSSLLSSDPELLSSLLPLLTGE
jgi:hypothetical protein